MKSSSRPESALVVGSGIIGIACAHYLAKTGMKVTVIDRGSIAGACSQQNCGFVCPSHMLPLAAPGAIGMALKSMLRRDAPFRVKPRVSPALWNWLWQFARRCNQRQMLDTSTPLRAILDSSMAEYRQIMTEERFDCEWEEKGLLHVFQTKEAMQAFEAITRFVDQEFDSTVEQIDGDQLPNLDPSLTPGLAGGLLFRGDSSLRPELLNEQWSSRLRERQVEFVEQCELQSIEFSAEQVAQVKTTKGELRAHCYVFALGAWSSQWERALSCNLPVQPGKGYSVTLPRPAVCPRYPMLFPEHKVGISPFDEGLRLGSTMEFSGFDETIPQHRIELLRKSAQPYLVQTLPEQDDLRWYGWRPMTWDSLPIIGQVPRLANAYLATGHNMLGLSLAPATGRLIAEIVQQQPTHVPAEPYSPERF